MLWLCICSVGDERATLSQWQTDTDAEWLLCPFRRSLNERDVDCGTEKQSENESHNESESDNESDDNEYLPRIDPARALHLIND